MMHQQDWISKWAVYSPYKVAVREYESGRTLTYGQLNRLGNRLAHYFFHQLNIGKGDRVAILAENCLEHLILFSAAQKTGCILVPLNFRLAGPEIDYLLDNAQPRLLISELKYEKMLKSTKSFDSINHHWTIKELTDYCDPELSSEEDPFFPIIPVAEDDPIFILFTSGTTGFPKGALYTHKMMFWNSINTSISLIVNSESRTINCMPFFHTGGWNVLVTPFLHHGGYVCLMKKFEAAAVLSLLQTEKVSVFMGVPTMLKMIAEEAGFEKADFGALHYIIVGGEPMPIPLIEQYHKKGVPIRQGYGMTEVGPNLTSLHQDDAIRKKGSIGRPNFYVSIKIADESGRALPPGRAGELLLEGPMVTPGYWRNAEATQKAFDGSWFHTGDRVLLDEEGYLFVVDRIKNMFISGGENVYPAEVERVIIAHPEVAEVAVIGVPDEKWGEVGKAFVVTKNPVKEDILMDFCRKNLGKFKVPKYLHFLPQLPKNDTGKINKNALREI